jgi:hypothetical protein
MYDDIGASLSNLEQWLERNGWRGYDPYDAKGTALFIQTYRLGQWSDTLRHVYEALLRLERRYPRLLRHLLFVKKQVNPKAMGLFGKAYLKLFHLTGESCYSHKAESCLEWLRQNRSVGYRNFCWGYPFDWQSRILIPRGTCSSVVSATVADAFWEHYLQTGASESLDVCLSVCEFFLSDLKIDRISNSEICFSYTPLDNFHVHNANLFVAEFLVRVGEETNNDELVDLGLQAMNYTLNEQNPDGSFCYSGAIDQQPCVVDHYHTGFVLRCLYNLFAATQNSDILDSLKLCYTHYIKRFFDASGAPRFTPDRTHPIDIHSCSEAILCLTTLSPIFPDARVLALQTARWTISNMQDGHGFFYHRMWHNRRVSKMPYIRWGQAWMLLALVNMVAASRNTDWVQNE